VKLNGKGRLPPVRGWKNPQSSAHLARFGEPIDMRLSAIFCGFVSFRTTGCVPQFCGLFVLIGIGPDKQCPMKFQRFPFNGRVRPPGAALRATEKQSFQTS
jgi:hypothetical protein